MIGERCRHLQRPLDDRIVGITRTIRGLGVRNVGNPQKHLTESFLNFVGLRGQAVFFVAEFATLLLQIVSSRRITVAPSGTDLLRELVHTGPDRIASGADVANLHIERYRLIELFEKIGLATTSEPGANRVSILTEKSNIDHSS
jgi:hypothetical protein